MWVHFFYVIFVTLFVAYILFVEYKEVSDVIGMGSYVSSGIDVCGVEDMEMTVVTVRGLQFHAKDIRNLAQSHSYLTCHKRHDDTSSVHENEMQLPRGQNSRESHGSVSEHPSQQ